MNKLTKLFLRMLVVTSILVLTYPATAERSIVETQGNGLGLEISMEGREQFTLSLAGKNRRQAILPVNAAKISAVKVVSWVEGDSLKFDVLAVVDKLPESATCDNSKELKAEQVGSYIAAKGEVVRISDFQKFGVAPFTVKVVAAAACPGGCCCCGLRQCCPPPPYCLGCGTCGICCP